MVLKLLTVGANGQPVQKSSETITLDLLSVKVGADGLEIVEASSSAFGFSGKKLSNIAAGAATGDAVEFDQLGVVSDAAAAAQADATQALSDAAAAQSAADGAQTDATQALSDAAAAKAEADALVTLSGVAALATGLGSFTGTTIPDASTIKAALQALETDLEAIPDPMVYKGLWAASSNTPTLADGVGHNGDVYFVSDNGTVDFGSGNVIFNQGDRVVYNGATAVWEKWDTTDQVSSVNSQTGAVSLDTDDIPEGTAKYYSSSLFNASLATKTTDNLTEGSTNKYFTAAAAKAAAVADSITDGVTDVAPSQNAVFDALALKADAAAAVSKTNDNGSSITVRQIAYVKSNGNIDLARADVAAIFDAMLVVVKASSIASAASGAVYVTKDIIPGFSGLTPGKKYYVSKASAGAIALYSAITFATGDNVVCVGKALSATELVFDPCFEFEF